VSPFQRWSLGPSQIEKLAFRPLRTGVEIHVLHETPDGVLAAVLRYAPGAEVPAHRHEGYEYIYVLEGEQGDERGSYGPGSFVVNAPGLVHSVTSLHGCVVLILWLRPVVFL
jgi:anti-sigma factor ChrR (cupin superfamily)